MKIIDKCSSALKPLGLAVALSFSVAPVAQATILSSYLTFDGPVHASIPPSQGGGEDKLNDDSVSKFLDKDSSGTFTGGDVIYGILNLSDFLSSGKPSTGVVGNQISILFSATITGLGSGGSIALGPTAAGADSLATLCGGICATAGIGASSIAVVLSTPTAASATEDPLNWTTANFTTNFNTLGPWSWEATLGLVAAAGNFFEFSGDNVIGGSERGAFTISSQAFAVQTWLPVDVFDFGGVVHTGDATLDRGIVDPAAGSQTANGWTFRDNASMYVNPLPVPEPGSVALMAIALAGFAGVTRGRRKQ